MHLIAKSESITCIYRYSLKNHNLYQEAIEQHGEHVLLYMTYDTELLESYAGLGIEPPTWIDEDEYTYIMNNDDIHKY